MGVRIHLVVDKIPGGQQTTLASFLSYYTRSPKTHP